MPSADGWRQIKALHTDIQSALLILCMIHTTSLFLLRIEFNYHFFCKLFTLDSSAHMVVSLLTKG